MRHFLYAGMLLITAVLPVTAWAVQVVTGSYVGNATDNTDIVISPACQPVAVLVKRDSAAVELTAKFSTMSGTESKNVTGTALLTTGIKAFNADGFRLGTATTTNSSGATHYYVAICENGQADVSVDTWAGDNTDNRDITLTGGSFTPEVCMVLSNGTGVQSWRGSTSHSGDSASRLNTLTSTQSNEIQSFSAGTMQVGSGLNATGTNYYSLCVKASSGVASGSFTGNTSDDRDITAIANPKFVLIKGDSTTAEPSHRFGIGGDASWCSADASAANIIQALSSTGFQVGTSTCANENTVTMRWFALTDFSAASFGPLRRRTQ